MKGDKITNTGLATSAVGTQGMLPAVNARGGKTTYTAGSLSIANLHTSLRYMMVQGAAKQIQWLQDAYQHTDFSDLLTSTYTGGAYVYGTSNGAASKEASVAYGFKEFFIDGFLLQTKVYPFNTEILTGRAPAIDQYRDYGLMIPQGTTLSKGKTISNVTVMYQEPPAVNSADGSVGNGIRVWRYGGASPNATDGTHGGQSVHGILQRGTLRRHQPVPDYRRSITRFFSIQGAARKLPLFLKLPHGKQKPKRTQQPAWNARSNQKY
jgi:hypothetical protein